MANIRIIVGTVMGTSSAVANAVNDYLQAKNHSSSVYESFSDEIFSDPNDILLVCTSNTGMGDLPANIMPFYHHLTTNFPRVAGQKYGVINLGDSSYPNFGQAGNTIDAALADLGAQRLDDILTLDACETDDHVAAALEWIKTWEAHL